MNGYVKLDNGYNTYLVKKGNNKKSRFTAEEDNLIVRLLKSRINISWKEIASYLPGRTANQCRDRFNQYLYKQTNNGPFTPEEDAIIVEKYKIYGPKWVKISQFLQDRTGNKIRNRWNCYLSKIHLIKHESAKIKRRPKMNKFGIDIDKIQEIQKQKESSIENDTTQQKSPIFKFPTIEQEILEMEKNKLNSTLDLDISSSIDRSIDHKNQ